MIFLLKRKTFTRWDDTDNLKRMKDSDILAEKRRRVHDYGKIARDTAVGAAAGLVSGAALGTIAGAGGNTWLQQRANGLVKGARYGATIGTGIGLSRAIINDQKNADDAVFFNRRLAYAQRQARRRERRDWKTNMTQRDGYSY